MCYFEVIYRSAANLGKDPLEFKLVIKLVRAGQVNFNVMSCKYYRCAETGDQELFSSVGK